MKITGSTIQQLDKTRPDGSPKPKSECRKWRLWVTTELGRKSRRFDGTYSQAQKALTAFVGELSEQIPNNETFAAYSASWLLWRDKSGEYAPGTIANNRREIAALNRSALSTQRMDAITPEICRDALLWIKLNPVGKSGELTNTTMNKIHTTLNAILTQAHNDGRIATNPMHSVKPPKPDTKEKEALSPDELALLVNRLDQLQLDGRVMALYLIALAGLRRGEACALYETDIMGDCLHISRAIKERNGTIAEPKSSAGVRVIPMTAHLAAKVDAWRKLKVRLGWFDSLTLCCNTHGGILLPQNLQRWWSGDSKHNGIRDEIGCSDMTLHQLRHSNLSMVSRHLSPFDLKSYAGWSSIEPAKVYIHDDLESVKRGIETAWFSIETQSNAPKTHQNESRPER